MPIVPAPIVMKISKGRRPKRLTLAEVEDWVSSMRAAGARDSAPVRGAVGMGGWLNSISAMPTSDDQAAGDE